MISRRFPLLLVAAGLACACSSGDGFTGLAPAQHTGGPTVLFDLARSPMPEVPFPTDLLARPDPASVTSVRVNVPLTAATQLEQNVRSLLDTLSGFGTFAPITVAFDADLDVADLFKNQNDPDPAKQAVFLIDLSDGTRVPLDFGAGHYPVALGAGTSYLPGDPLAGVRNLLFPVSGPSANFFQPAAPHPDARSQIDDLITFYERASRTLLIRPVVPLAQKHRYAVVLTNRLRGTTALAVQSPHSGINHAAQTDELRPLTRWLPPGTSLSDVAYTWAFTTQAATQDLEAIHDGLYTLGRLGALSFQYPVQASAGDVSSQVYGSLIRILQERGEPFDPAVDTQAENYVVTPEDLRPFLEDPAVQPFLPIDTSQLQALEDTLQYVRYFVSARFSSPNFLIDPGGDTADTTFRVDISGGNTRAVNDFVFATFAVPKEDPLNGHMQPFPVVIAGHGYGSSRLEPILAFSGSFAKFGLATAAIDAYGHGLSLDPFAEAALRALGKSHNVEGFVYAALQGRARDLDNDGVKDPGADFFTGNAFHTRDMIRQSAVDWMQLSRMLMTFDGAGRMALGSIDVPLAGDFDEDGIPDLGGPAKFPFDVPGAGGTIVFNKGERNPGSDTFAFGESLGGILASIVPAVDPSFVAAAPVSAGGGLTDVVTRTSLAPVIRGVFLQLLGPFVTTCAFDPAAGPIDWQHTTDPASPAHFGACGTSGANTLVLVVADGNVERDLPLGAVTLAEGDRVMVQNLAHATQPCDAGQAAAGCSVGQVQGGALRVPVGADGPAVLSTSVDQPSGVPQVTTNVVRAGDPLRITVLRASGAPQVIDHFAADVTFLGVTYHANDPLVSPASGYGLSRNTPEFRRLLALSQAMLEPGDPVNYAPHWFRDTLPARANVPVNVLVVGTAGDTAVPVETSITLARAAGIVDLATPLPAYGGRTADQVLTGTFATEGIADLRRAPDAAAAGLPIRCDEPSACTGDAVVDVSGLGCDPAGNSCSDTFEGGAGAPRLTPPLRDPLIVESARSGVACPVNPRGQAGVGCWSTGASACATDANGNAQAGVSALLLPYLARAGQHGFGPPQPQKAFDVDTFMANVIGRYFECRGRELDFDRCQAKISSAVSGGCPWIPTPPGP